MQPGLQPEFYRQIHHNKLRRAFWHDYHAPSLYMITMTKRQSVQVPLFSNLIKKGNGEIDVKFTWSGWAIFEALSMFSNEYPFIRLGRYVIMPDHVHIIMQVAETIPKHFGFYVNKLKTYCTQCFKSKSKAIAPTDESIFEDGYNDRVLFRKGQLDAWSRYVKDNPRRLWLIKNNPGYFSRSYLFSKECPDYLWNFSVNVNDKTISSHLFPTFGNAQLLKYPEKIEVKFSRSFSEEEWNKRKRAVLKVAKNGGVLVTPAIHEEEKRLLNEGILLGARVIKVIGYGFEQKEKPQGEDFHHCAEGRMLLFALNQYQSTNIRGKISRVLCERMNECAKWIATESF